MVEEGVGVGFIPKEGGGVSVGFIPKDGGNVSVGVIPKVPGVAASTVFFPRCVNANR